MMLPLTGVDEATIVVTGVDDTIVVTGVDDDHYCCNWCSYCCNWCR